jgi:hypothetical protein
MFAKALRIASATALLAFAFSGPAARAQLGAPGASLRSAAVDPGFLIGSWSDTGDCATTIAFTADGAFATADGSEGQWSLMGDTLTLTGEGGARTLTIVPIDRNTMEVIGEDGSHDRSTRCAGDLGDVHFDDPHVA